MSRKDFISDNLVHMRDRLREHAEAMAAARNAQTETAAAPEEMAPPEAVPSPESTVRAADAVQPEEERLPTWPEPPAIEEPVPSRADAPPVEPVAVPEAVLPVPPPAEEQKKAVRQRIAEIKRTRRDLLTRLHREHSGLQTELEKQREQYKETEFFADFLTCKLAEIENGDSEITPENLRNSARMLENVRLEYLRALSRYERLQGRNAAAGGEAAHTAGVLPELLSLSFGQLVRFGLALFLPVVIAVLLGALLLTLGYFAAVRW